MTTTILDEQQYAEAAAGLVRMPCPNSSAGSTTAAVGEGANDLSSQKRKRFYKTRLCPYHFKKGSICKGGDSCSYAHSFGELRPSVDLTKTKLCQNFLNGLCLRKADDCPFAHGATDIRPIKCMNETCAVPVALPQRQPVAAPPSIEPWPAESAELPEFHSYHQAAKRIDGDDLLLGVNASVSTRAFFSATLPGGGQGCWGPRIGGVSAVSVSQSSSNFRKDSRSYEVPSSVTTDEILRGCRSSETAESTKTSLGMQRGKFNSHQLNSCESNSPPYNDFTPSPLIPAARISHEDDDDEDDIDNPTIDNNPNNMDTLDVDPCCSQRLLHSTRADQNLSQTTYHFGDLQGSNGPSDHHKLDAHSPIQLANMIAQAAENPNDLVALLKYIDKV